MEQWKNIIFFRKILVSKYTNVISAEDYPIKKQNELAILLTKNNQEDAKEITKLQEICDNQDISGLIALPIEVWHFIASYLSIEEYFNPNFSTRDDDVLLVKDAHLDLNLDV